MAKSTEFLTLDTPARVDVVRELIQRADHQIDLGIQYEAGINGTAPAVILARRQALEDAQQARAAKAWLERVLRTGI